MSKIPTIVCLCLFLMAPYAAWAASGSIGELPENRDRDPQELKESLEQQQRTVRERRRQIQILSGQERKLNAGLAAAEDRLAELEARIRLQEEALALLERSEQEASLRYAELSREYAKTREQVEALLRIMWPLHVQQRAERYNLVEWQRAERDFAWSLELSRILHRRQEELHRQEAEVGEALSRQQELYARLTEQVRTVSVDKDRLLSDKLNFIHELHQVREAQESAEGSLASLMGTIEAMNLELDRARSESDFNRRKGRLIWPATGSIVEHYAPNAKPPAHGLGFALADGAPIRSVAGGKVLYNGILRGFGHVVIVLHESEYYSLYAFLKESLCDVGQMIGPGDTIGLAGFYPAAQGSGLYFELRFQKKAINPETWLTSAS